MKNPDQITNRHIAKLLSRLDFLNLPQMAKDDIVRQLHFLKEDVLECVNSMEKVRDEKNNDRVR